MDAISPTMTARFWPKVDKTEGCWTWTAGRDRKGYGRVSNGHGRSPLLAHRVAWTLTHGAIPEGMQLDHLCRNPACVNPAHLEVVDNRENTLRGQGPTAVNARKDTCKRGHSLADAYVSKGMRYCRTCALEKQRLLRTTGRGVLP